MTCETPKIDPQRLWDDLMRLGELTEPARPYSRRSFSELHREGRAFLEARMRAAGLDVRMDAAGNLIGRLPGLDPKAGVLATGSHSDTVQGGGRFDGVAGVVAALEAARAIASSGQRLRHDLEVIDFLAEEPSDFGLSCIGSRGMSGVLDSEMLAMTDLSGQTLHEALQIAGGAPQDLAAALRSDIRAFVELHIEQGPVLEAEGLDIGVVQSIAGVRRIEIDFQGQAAHAGTAPMDVRRDAAYAGARTLVQVRERAEALSLAGQGYFVATVGQMELRPGGANVVAAHARLVIDARSSSSDLTEQFTRLIDEDSQAAARQARVERTVFKILSDGVPATCDATIQDASESAARGLGLGSRRMVSGAGHDAAFLARICPAGMIFIPCLRGMSHTPDEWAEPHQVAVGTQVLLDTLLRLDDQMR